MKRIMSLLILAVLLLTFCSCAKDEQVKNTITLYSPSEIREVPLEDFEQYNNGEWATTPMCRMYSLDGRTLAVRISDVEAFKDVGWYTEPVATVYSPDGRSMIIPCSDLDKFCEKGWYSIPMAYGETPSMHLSSPALTEDFLKYANDHAEDLFDFYDSFSYGLLYEFDSQNEIKGPAHEDGNIWYEITDERIKSFDDLETAWLRHFSKESNKADAFKIYTEIDGKVCVAARSGFGGFIPSNYVYTSVINISGTEVNITGKTSPDFDGDGDISNNAPEDISDTVLVLVLEDGKWKCKLS